jgi:hypothetical protein
MTSELCAEVAFYLPLNLSEGCVFCFWATQLQLGLSLLREAGIFDLLVRLCDVFLHPFVIQRITSGLYFTKFAIYARRSIRLHRRHFGRITYPALADAARPAASRDRAQASPRPRVPAPTPPCTQRRAGTEIAARGQAKHLHYSRDVTVEEMRQASMALMRLVPTEPGAPQKVGTSVGTCVVGTGIRMRNDLQRPELSRRPA